MAWKTLKLGVNLVNGVSECENTWQFDKNLEEWLLAGYRHYDWTPLSASIPKEDQSQFAGCGKCKVKRPLPLQHFNTELFKGLGDIVGGIG